MRRRLRLLAVFVAACIAMLVLLLPLRIALDAFAGDGPLQAREVSGSLWSGQLRGARWGAIALDTLDLRLRVLPLLYGQQHWALASPHLRATVVRGRVRGLRDAHGELGLSAHAWPGADLRLNLDGATALFRDGRCENAGGRIGLDLQLDADAGGGDPGPALRLDGRAVCAGPVARIELAPAGSLPPGIEAATIAIDIDANGGYDARATIRSDLPGIALGLQAQGFEPGAAGLERSDRGRLPY
ncbi:hypothetical protein FKV24_006980 [Lysobacter maris]|uniref:Type II secretion system protein N n=1 Tax=Marilutibacter maris TaxID=1605891 RepID=A0A508AUQ5_9GAMM|nr:type II secretion system protein N [Lysobacter maris]KAB8192960.1 hypothetical protein FKV24_006980 [Lysobacter maris]